MTIGTLADLAALPGMPSQPSLQRFIAARSDFPVLERGRYGRAYVIDLEHAVAFIQENWRDGRRLDPDHETLRQLPLNLERDDDG